MGRNSEYLEGRGQVNKLQHLTPQHRKAYQRNLWNGKALINQQRISNAIIQPTSHLRDAQPAKEQSEPPFRGRAQAKSK